MLTNSAPQEQAAKTIEDYSHPQKDTSCTNKRHYRHWKISICCGLCLRIESFSLTNLAFVRLEGFNVTIPHLRGCCREG